MKCVACGDHPLNYIHCDRWDCPLLMVREAIEAGDVSAVAVMKACIELVERSELAEDDDEHPDQNGPA